MIPLDEFYKLSLEEQEKLVDEGYVVVDGELADEIPSRSRTGIHILETPVVEQIIELLKQGQYKKSEIAPELPIDRETLDEFISDLRYDRRQTMTEHKGVVRAAGTDGAANVYTVDPLPFQVRTLDPTLSGYLLLTSGLMPSTEPPADEADSQTVFSVYADRVQSYWGLPETELLTEVDQRARFVNSALGPLPMPREFPDAETVRARTMDVEAAYVHKQYTPRKVYHGICLRKTQVRRNPSLPAFQEFASYLLDVYRYSRFENDTEVRDLAKQGAELYFCCLYGNYRPTETTEWYPFEIKIVENDLSKTDMQVLNIVEFQPTMNSELANEWGFDESSQVFTHIQNALDRFAMRNSDKFICATETARRRVCKLVDEGVIEVTKAPPVVPTPAKTPIEEPEHQSSDSDRGTTSPGT